MIKQTFPPTNTSEPTVRSVSLSFMVYGILFAIWLTVQFAK
jgi:hypothetical protein